MFMPSDRPPFPLTLTLSPRAGVRGKALRVKRAPWAVSLAKVRGLAKDDSYARMLTQLRGQEKRRRSGPCFVRIGQLQQLGRTPNQVEANEHIDRLFCQVNGRNPCFYDKLVGDVVDDMNKPHQANNAEDQCIDVFRFHKKQMLFAAKPREAARSRRECAASPSVLMMRQ
jgi:hypothetical protein